MNPISISIPSIPFDFNSKGMLWHFGHMSIWGRQDMYLRTHRYSYIISYIHNICIYIIVWNTYAHTHTYVCIRLFSIRCTCDDVNFVTLRSAKPILDSRQSSDPPGIPKPWPVSFNTTLKCVCTICISLFLHPQNVVWHTVITDFPLAGFSSWTIDTAQDDSRFNSEAGRKCRCGQICF